RGSFTTVFIQSSSADGGGVATRAHETAQAWDKMQWKPVFGNTRAVRAPPGDACALAPVVEGVVRWGLRPPGPKPECTARDRKPVRLTAPPPAPARPRRGPLSRRRAV